MSEREGSSVPYSNGLDDQSNEGQSLPPQSKKRIDLNDDVFAKSLFAEPGTSEWECLSKPRLSGLVDWISSGFKNMNPSLLPSLPEDPDHDLPSPNSSEPTGPSPDALVTDRSESPESSNNDDSDYAESDDSDYAESIIRNASRSQRKRLFDGLAAIASPDEHEEQCATMQAEKRRRRHVSASDDNNDDDNSMTSSGAGSDANVASVDSTNSTDDNSSSGSSSSVAAPQLPPTVEQRRDISLRQWIDYSGLRLNDLQIQLLKQNLLRRGNMKKMQQLLKHKAFKDVFRFTSDDESSLEIKTGFVYKFTALCCYFENDLKGKACTGKLWDDVRGRAKELWTKAWLGADCEDGWSSKTKKDRSTTTKKSKTTSARK